MKNTLRTYVSPSLTVFGDIGDITGVLGNAFTGDVLVDMNGNVEAEGNLSIDACPTQDFEQCQINP